jgi:hypothetical protein
MQDVATQMHLNINTIVRWMQEPGFAADYAEARRQLVTHAIAHMQSLCRKATQKLEETLDSAETTAAVRMQAVKLVFDIAIKGLELEEVIRRLRNLEDHFLQKGTP